MKRYLFVLRKPAHSGSILQETLDIVLTAAAFDQQVSLLLLDDAVFHLKNTQFPEKQSMKDTCATFKALELYDVTQVYVEQESLHERGLVAEDLCLPIILVHRNVVAGLMQQFDVLFAS